MRNLQFLKNLANDHPKREKKAGARIFSLVFGFESKAAVAKLVILGRLL